MTETYINDEMSAAIGSIERQSVSFPISASDIRKWAMAVYYPEPPPRLFWDAEYAAGTRYGGIVAPEDFNPFAWMSANGPRAARQGDAGVTSREIGLGIKPPPVENQLNGGVEVEFGVRMRPGDVITSVTRLHSYTEREGRLGRMLFTTSETVWTNQNDEVVKTSRDIHIRY
jgi:hypothetical protein